MERGLASKCSRSLDLSTTRSAKVRQRSSAGLVAGSQPTGAVPVPRAAVSGAIASRATARVWSFARSVAISDERAQRSVKPPAQPTLVRTQHLPPATAPGRGCSGVPGSSSGHAARCHQKPPSAAGRGICPEWMAPGRRRGLAKTRSRTWTLCPASTDAGCSHVRPPRRAAGKPGGACGQSVAEHTSPMMLPCGSRKRAMLPTPSISVTGRMVWAPACTAWSRMAWGSLTST